MALLFQGLGLVFVAVYQKALALLYVDTLLERVKATFVTKFYEPGRFDYKLFGAAFRQLVEEAESRAEQQRLARMGP